MLKGNNFIGFDESSLGDQQITSFSTLENRVLDASFMEATDAEIEAALRKATHAFKALKKISDQQRAEFLEAIADEIEANAEENIKIAMLESGLPQGRLQGETGRTTGQLRFFAQIVKEGSYMQPIIDVANPDRSPMPKPGLRTRNIPLGPVVVFSASNFPFAFSTAGGDTVSAFAAGCPVIVKAHPSHLGTNELISRCIIRAAKKTGMPDGIFSSLNGGGAALGKKLAEHPDVKAIGFTGSRNAGLALMNIAAQREVPIPVYAEMSSINPIVILPELLSTKAEETATKLADSITLGAGQFCTNPGLIFLIKDANSNAFITSLTTALKAIAPQVMLNKGIANNYFKLKQSFNQHPATENLVEAKDEITAFKAAPALHHVSSKDFREQKSLHQEVFGPSSLIVLCENKEDLIKSIEHCEGQLTATIFSTKQELSHFTDVLDALTDKAGRIIFNNVPTGVEVSYAMMHGGPYPATSDGRTTSVGGEAIKRYLRPVCFQDFPDEVLPEGLKDNNYRKILRKVDGLYTNGSL